MNIEYVPTPLYPSNEQELEEFLEAKSIASRVHALCQELATLTMADEPEFVEFPGDHVEFDRQSESDSRILENHRVDKWWDGLSYETQTDAFCAVVRRIVEGDIQKQGSYRSVLYETFGFGLDMYVRGMDCGYMTLHNAISRYDKN